MKKTRSNDRGDRSNREGFRRRRNREDFGEEDLPRKRRDAGKRFHRQKTLKEALWQDEAE